MDRVQETAESIFEWLKFTTDLPEDHEQGAVPMLDLQVWLEDPGADQGESRRPKEQELGRGQQQQHGVCGDGRDRQGPC